jgi:hypothetical protein
VYYALTRNPAPEPVTEQPTATAPQAAEPVVLSQVVEVTDTDLLLEPQPDRVSGVPFDSAEPLNGSTNVNTLTPNPPPIPLAAD